MKEFPGAALNFTIVDDVLYSVDDVLYYRIAGNIGGNNIWRIA